MKVSLFPRSAALTLATLALASLIVGFLFGNVRSSRLAYDLVITNARVVDGSGNPWFRADVAIQNGRIVSIGKIPASDARQTIDANNQILAPGFIDVHTHVESIYSLPEAENFIRMGVTTLVTGNCGSSATDIGEFQIF